jgi:hypothetical protein
LVQSVIIEFEDENLQVHASNLLRISKPLLDWYFDDDLIQRGFLEDKDIPIWTTPKQKKILKSRCKLFYGHYRLLKSREQDGWMGPTEPVKLYKYADQYLYNKGKPGVDKNTELTERLRHSTKLSFETKYILRIFDAILINSWRVIQAIEMLNDFNQDDDQRASHLRRRLRDLTIDDFTLDFSINYLRELRVRTSSVDNADLPIVIRGNAVDDLQQIYSRTDQDVLRRFSEYKARTRVWPKKREPVGYFAKPGILKDIRLYKSRGVEHKLERAPVTARNPRGRHQCRLCFVGKTAGGRFERNSIYLCSICEVPLCTTPFDRTLFGSKSCFQRWHEAKDLVREQHKCQDRLIQLRRRERGNANLIIPNAQETEPEAEQGVPDEVGIEDVGEEELATEITTPAVRREQGRRNQHWTETNASTTSNKSRKVRRSRRQIEQDQRKEMVSKLTEKLEQGEDRNTDSDADDFVDDSSEDSFDRLVEKQIGGGQAKETSVARMPAKPTSELDDDEGTLADVMKVIDLDYNRNPDVIDLEDNRKPSATTRIPPKQPNKSAKVTNVFEHRKPPVQPSFFSRTASILARAIEAVSPQRPVYTRASTIGTEIAAAIAKETADEEDRMIEEDDNNKGNNRKRKQQGDDSDTSSRPVTRSKTQQEKKSNRSTRKK